MTKAQLGLRIDEKIKTAFTEKCKQDNIKVYEAVEALIKLYLSGEIIIKNEVRAILSKGE